jgi:signal peptidase I
VIILSDNIENEGENLEEILETAEIETGAAEIETETAPKTDRSEVMRLEILDWIQCVVSTLVAVIIIFIFVGREIGVDGHSMNNTLHHMDKVLITDVFYKPKYGDIVIIHVDKYDEVPLVKRVIATAGQTVDIDFDAHTVTVDGTVLNEPYIREPTSRPIDFIGPVTVPEGCIFVMGDNRNASNDSRDAQVGFIDTRNVLGKVHLIALPGKDDYGVRDWSRIGSVYKTTP